MHGLTFSPQRLTAKRVEAELTMQELARRASLSPRTIRRLERGQPRHGLHRTRPWDLTLGKVARALGCRIEDLMVPSGDNGAAA